MKFIKIFRWIVIAGLAFLFVVVALATYSGNKGSQTAPQQENSAPRSNSFNLK